MTDKHTVCAGEKLDLSKPAYDSTEPPVVDVQEGHIYVVVIYNAGQVDRITSVPTTDALDNLLFAEAFMENKDSFRVRQIATQLQLGAPFVWALGVGSCDGLVLLKERWTELLPTLPATNYGWKYSGPVG